MLYAYLLVRRPRRAYDLDIESLQPAAFVRPNKLGLSVSINDSVLDGSFLRGTASSLGNTKIQWVLGVSRLSTSCVHCFALNVQ